MSKALTSIFLIGIILMATIVPSNALFVEFNYATQPGDPFAILLGVIQDYIWNLYSMLLQTNDTIEKEIIIRAETIKNYAYMQTLSNLTYDLSEYTKDNAFRIGVYTAIKELINGSNATVAKQKAHDVVKQYFYNITLNLVTWHNETVEEINETFNHYIDNVQLSKWYFDGKEKSYCGSWNIKVQDLEYNNDSYTLRVKIRNKWVKNGTWTHIGYISGWEAYATLTQEPRLTLTEKSTLFGLKYKALNIEAPFKVKKKWTSGWEYQSATYTSVVYTITFAGSEIYNYTAFSNTLNKIDSDYNYVNANIDAVVDNVVNAIVSGQLNETELAMLLGNDPMLLAEIMNMDINTTGYYGLAVGELVLLGIPISGGINATFNITVGNETIDGWLFTDWNTTFVLGQNYTVPPDVLVYIITPDGKVYRLEEGDVFTINDIRDARTGEQLNSTTIYVYYPLIDSESIEWVTQLLEAYNQLWQDYLNLSTIVSGGESNGSSWEDTINWLMGQWWFWVFVGIGAIVLIGRSFGRGGVSVIKLGK